MGHRAYRRGLPARARGGIPFAALLWALCLSTTGAAQEILEHRWGFDGRVVLNRFNLLTVEVRNPTDRAIDKHLQLTKTLGFAAVGAPIVQRCYLGPNTTRRFEFAPFISSSADSWSLSWVERGAADASLGPPPVGIAATVLLEPDPLVRTRPLKLKRFPPSLLPATADMMDGLRAVVMDHSPEMSITQQRALVEWVQRGGEVHLLARDARAWQLEEELAVLNSAAPVTAFGSGRVFRHEFDRTALEKDLPKELFGGVVYRPDPEAAALAEKLRRWVLSVSESLNYGWGLIFTLTVVYLLLIGPGFFRLTNRLSWPLSLLALAGVIGAATWVFNVVGARSGETSRSKSFCLVRPVGQEYEVTRFANVFVTAPGSYTFGDGDRRGLFSSAQSQERVLGQITNGSKASYTLDMPRYSKRLIVHKSQVPGPEHGASFTDDFRTALDFEEVLSINDSQVHYYTLVGPGHWRRVANQSRSILSFQRGYEIPLERLSLEEIATDQLWLQNVDPKQGATHPSHHVFFCRQRELPGAFRLRGRGPGTGLGEEEGWAVYRFDFFR